MASSLTLNQLGKDCRSGPGFSPTSSSPFSVSLTPATVLSFPPLSRAACSPLGPSLVLSHQPGTLSPSRPHGSPPSFRQRREDSYLPAEWPACLSCHLATVLIISFFYFFHFFFVSLYQNVNPFGAKIIICFLSGPVSLAP